MNPSPLPERLIIATHNDGKWREFVNLLSPFIPHIVSAGSLGLPEPEETGASFTENAILKARAARMATGDLALSDDSGLCVTSLGGRPGIYSARWAQTASGKDFSAAMRRIQNELGDQTDHSASFICVLALSWPDGHDECFEGRIDGTLVFAPRGKNGHGYDPFFVPLNETRTFAEMSSEEKNAISHRSLATSALIKRLSCA